MRTKAESRHESLKRLLSVAKEISGIEGPAALASALSESEQTVTNWASRGVSKAGAMKAQAKFGCSSNWVLHGSLPRLVGALNGTLSNNVTLASMGANRVPLISYVQAGAWTEAVDNFNPGDAEDWLMTDLKLSKTAFALEIKGDSMLPEFKPGDRVIIDPEVEPMPGDFVAAKNGKEEATFKKYRPRGADGNGKAVFELVPLNEDFESLRSDVEPIRIVGTMVEHRKYRRAR